jgi:hypothetical protein
MNLLILTIKVNSYFFHNPCHDSLDPFSKPWDLDSRLGGRGTRVTDGLFFKLLEDKNSKTNFTPSLIRFNQRLGGYSIWSASFIAPHINKNFTTTRGMGASQPRCSQGSTRKTPSGVRKNSKTPSEVLESSQYLTTKSSGAYQTRDHGSVHMAYIF